MDELEARVTANLAHKPMLRIMGMKDLPLTTMAYLRKWDEMWPGATKLDLVEPERRDDARADVRWWADARVEPRAYTEEGCQRLYDSGCRKLLFGFETATPPSKSW